MLVTLLFLKIGNDALQVSRQYGDGFKWPVVILSFCSATLLVLWWAWIYIQREANREVSSLGKLFTWLLFFFLLIAALTTAIGVPPGKIEDSWVN